jgi:hypothetical protein
MGIRNKVAVAMLCGIVSGPAQSMGFGFGAMDRDEAMALARRVVGADVLEVIPYIDRGSSHQKVAVLAKDPESACCPRQANVFLLDGMGRTFRSIKTELTTVQDEGDLIPESMPKDRKPGRVPRWGIVDIDDDGIHEIFSIGYSYGSASGGYSISLYSSDTELVDTAGISFSWGKPPDPVEFSIASKRKEKIVTDWLLEQSDALTEKFGLIDPDDETYIWEKNNGTGFHQGKIKLHEVNGQVKTEGSTSCVVHDGEMVWTSYFKGDIYGYDSKRDIHFVIYSPSNTYEWANFMVAGKEYLWLGVTLPTELYDPDKRSILTYHKTNGELKSFPVPELGKLLCYKPGQCTNDIEAISNGFTVKNGKLELLGKQLTLPESISDDELKGASTCK